MKRSKAEDKQTSKAASPSARMMPIKAPTPTRTVTTRTAPAEFKQPPPQPPPPPPREERKEPIAIRSRTPTRRAAPRSARDREAAAHAYPWPGYASSRASSTSHREEETPPANELLETMKAMQKQLDELKKEKGETSHRRRRRSRSHSRGRRRRSRTRSDSRDSRRRTSRRPRTPSPPRAELRGRPPLPRPPSVPPPDRSRSESERHWPKQSGYSGYNAYVANRWPAHWKFPVLRQGPESWNRRVQVGKTPVELLDELYFAENKGWGFKSRCLRWIGPYFPAWRAGGSYKYIARLEHLYNLLTKCRNLPCKWC